MNFLVLINISLPCKTCSKIFERLFADVMQEYSPESVVVRFLITKCETVATLCSVIIEMPPLGEW